MIVERISPASTHNGVPDLVLLPVAATVAPSVVELDVPRLCGSSAARSGPSEGSAVPGTTAATAALTGASLDRVSTRCACPHRLAFGASGGGGGSPR